MIIIKISGGLGNQMFQYAFGRAIELEKKEKVIYDISWFNRSNFSSSVTKRDFELSIFNVNIQNFRNFPYFNFLIHRSNGVKKVFFRFTRFLGILSEKQEIKPYTYDKNMLNLVKKSIYIHGYFQTETYFLSQRRQILADFKLKGDLSEFSQNYLKKIRNINAVSIHVRRGDYISNETARKVHGTCSNEYYEKAISLIKEKVVDPTFFIFSDDLNWVKNQKWLINLNSVLAKNNSEKQNYEDLILMSKCKHNIIANSSFSWWGAWLNANEEKIVVSPKEWFADSKKNQMTTNLIPSEWYRI